MLDLSSTMCQLLRIEWPDLEEASLLPGLSPVNGGTPAYLLRSPHEAAIVFLPHSSDSASTGIGEAELLNWGDEAEAMSGCVLPQPHRRLCCGCGWYAARGPGGGGRWPTLALGDSASQLTLHVPLADGSERPASFTAELPYPSSTTIFIGDSWGPSASTGITNVMRAAPDGSYLLCHRREADQLWMTSVVEEMAWPMPLRRIPPSSTSARLLSAGPEASVKAVFDLRLRRCGGIDGEVDGESVPVVHDDYLSSCAVSYPSWVTIHQRATLEPQHSFAPPPQLHASTWEVLDVQAGVVCDPSASTPPSSIQPGCYVVTFAMPGKHAVFVACYDPRQPATPVWVSSALDEDDSAGNEEQEDVGITPSTQVVGASLHDLRGVEPSSCVVLHGHQRSRGMAGRRAFTHAFRLGNSGEEATLFDWMHRRDEVGGTPELCTISFDHHGVLHAVTSPTTACA